MRISRFHVPRRFFGLLAAKPMVLGDEGPWMTVRQHEEVVEEMGKRLTQAQGESLLLAITTVAVAYQEEKMRRRSLEAKLKGEINIEAIAEAAHNAWLAEKKQRGVTTWPNEHGFEQMVPYDQCPEDVKEFDRVVIRAIAVQMIKEAESD